jgi:fused signal recognition particle receptor
MIALWIVLGVVVVAVLTGLVVGTRRRGNRRRQTTAPVGPPAEAVRPAGDVTQTEAPPAGPSRAPPAPSVITPARPAPAPAAPEGPPSFRERLGKARGLLSGVVGSIRERGALQASTWDELEEALLRADVGVTTTEALLADLRRRVASKEVGGGPELIDALRADLVGLLRVEGPGGGVPDGPGVGEPGSGDAAGRTGRELRFDTEPGVTNVWLFVGVNGVGKTTTVGKVARQQARSGRSVLLAAADTFRAAAGEQLETWATRADVEIVRGTEGGDPSAIVFDAVRRAAARGNDLVLADTAGRLHTKVNLVEELKKIRRVADRAPGRVTEVLLVLDATTGQNALAQARQFTDAVSVTGLVLTKLDGSAKGGIVVAVQRELGIPVKLVGLGEGPDDLVPFDAEAFVDALLG